MTIQLQHTKKEKKQFTPRFCFLNNAPEITSRHLACQKQNPMTNQRTILYTHAEFTRPIAPDCLLRYFKLDIDNVEITDDWERFCQRFPVRTVPSLITADGHRYFEQMAVNHYLIRKSGQKGEIEQLLGSNDNYALQSEIIIMICSFCTSDFLNAFCYYCLHDLKTIPIDDVTTRNAQKKLETMYPLFEEKLTKHKYLTGDAVTLADLVSSSSFTLGFHSMFDKEWRDRHHLLAKWYDNMIHSNYMAYHYRDFTYVDKAHKIVEQPLPADIK